MEPGENNNDSENKEIEISPNVLAAFHVFIHHFEPTSQLSQSDEQLSSADIADILSELLSPFEYNISTIYKLMWENGYRYVFTDGFKWLLKIRPH